MIPNWKRMGFESKVEGWKHVISELVKNKKKITSKGLGNEVTFQLGDEMFVIKGGKKK